MVIRYVLSSCHFLTAILSANYVRQLFEMRQLLAKPSFDSSGMRGAGCSIIAPMTKVLGLRE
jgi:hypothetical protein